MPLDFSLSLGRVDIVRFLFFFKAFCLIGISLFLALPSAAQDTCEVCAERYMEIATDRRIQAEVDYLLPTDPLDLDRSKKKKQADDDALSSDTSGPDLSAPGDIGWFLISAIILLGIALVIIKNSSGGLVSFGSRPEEGTDSDKRRGASGKPQVDHSDLPQSDAAFLAEIEGMADRQHALHLLSGRLLAKAAEKAGIRPGRSWTARESLRALPQTLNNLADLRHVNRHAELAWFGGRIVDESIFQDCLARARDMMRRGMAA